MKQDVLPPGVQHGGETDFRSQVPGRGGNLLQGAGGGSEQDIKKDGLVAESERIQFLRNGEDDVEVRNRKERGQSFSRERWLRERRVSRVGCGCARRVPA